MDGQVNFYHPLVMRRTVLVYGSIFALLIFVMKFIEYRYLVRDLSLEFYLGVVAVIFMVLGVWAGLRITSRKTIVITGPAADFILDEDRLRQMGISKREHEVLELMATGLSNQEIADKLFVSLNTIKTHTSNLFLKLDAKRRTQAIQKAKELRILRP
jgi:NarL family two-component system response regulator LiaR